MSKLSNLKVGDHFKFEPHQTLFYIYNERASGSWCMEYITNNFSVFEVLKQNQMSCKVKPIDGRIEYYFKYKGKVNNDKFDAVDGEVVIVEKT